MRLVFSLNDVDNIQKTSKLVDLEFGQLEVLEFGRFEFYASYLGNRVTAA